MPEHRLRLLGSLIDVISWEQALGRIVRWALAGQSRTVCLCNVHGVVTARRDPALAAALASADLCTPDGAPLAWLMRQRGCPEQQRISGPDLMWQLLGEAQRLRLPVFLLGGSDSTLARLREVLHTAWPTLVIAGMHSPPYRALQAQEQQVLLGQITASGARLVFVGLGCPKQELWMAAMRGQLPAVMLGVGAAFDYHAGTLARAPLAWQAAGLEWLYRWCREPARLMKRYLLTNTLFLLALPGELWKRPRS